MNREIDAVGCDRLARRARSASESDHEPATPPCRAPGRDLRERRHARGVPRGLRRAALRVGGDARPGRRAAAGVLARRAVGDRGLGEPCRPRRVAPARGGARRRRSCRSSSTRSSTTRWSRAGASARARCRSCSGSPSPARCRRGSAKGSIALRERLEQEGAWLPASGVPTRPASPPIAACSCRRALLLADQVHQERRAERGRSCERDFEAVVGDHLCAGARERGRRYRRSANSRIESARATQTRGWIEAGSSTALVKRVPSALAPRPIVPAPRGDRALPRSCRPRLSLHRHLAARCRAPATASAAVAAPAAVAGRTADVRFRPRPAPRRSAARRGRRPASSAAASAPAPRARTSSRYCPRQAAAPEPSRKRHPVHARVRAHAEGADSLAGGRTRTTVKRTTEALASRKTIVVAPFLRSGRTVGRVVLTAARPPLERVRTNGPAELAPPARLNRVAGS